ncbi:MAG TPA: cobamide remodeling phosphodiesterase CbiR [Anaerolineae bacterium]|nr:cobamide remodeling phosphodiesterase CbiR [Anaerolineae bacterium]
MRYGIMTLQPDTLIPAGMDAQQAMAHVAGLDHVAIAAHLFDQGFDPVELSGDLLLLIPHTFAPDTIARLRDLKAARGTAYTIHLPLWSVEPSTLLEPVREASVRALVDMIRRVQPLDPEVYVLHATGAMAAEFYAMGLPEFATAFLMRQFQANARRSLETILAETGLDSRRLAIETIEFPLDLTLELAGALDLSICLDVGHVLAGFSGPVPFFDAVARCLPRLAEVHLHDAPQASDGERLYGKDHKPLGVGDLDVARLLRTLEDAGFHGPLVFELMERDALASLQAIRAVG